MGAFLDTQGHLRKSNIHSSKQQTKKNNIYNITVYKRKKNEKNKRCVHSSPKNATNLKGVGLGE